MNNRSHAKATRGSRIRTVIVQISRKLRATYRVRTGRLFSRLLAALLGVYAAQVFALPQGGVVQSGAVTINTPNANSMVLNQGTNKAVIDWQSFSIGSGQSVQFLQPGASSVALNRVVGGDVSSIFGSLSANGQVFLVNPNGVLFAPGAQVNVGGLVASTLNLSNADFLAGNYTFSGNSGASVVNNGMIRAGYVALAGAQVTNAGTIEAAQGGSIGLLAGSRVTVDPAGAGLVKFSVDGAAVDAAASNSGTLVAEGGQVAMLASAVSDTLPTVINQSGVIRANSVAENNGVVTLSGGATGIVKVSGTIEARGDNAGETGGTVKVLGDRVGLMAGAKVDASGDAGGGTVLVGGNFQGKGPEQNALVTLVDRSATVNADATGQGDGGRIIVWADDTTRFAGQISARGGVAGGDGGFAEVSGKNHLAFQGGADLRAPQGQTGTLLLDPTDLKVVHDDTGVADSFINFDASNPAEFHVISSDPGPSVITDATINAQLAVSNVVVQTSPIGAGSGDITFDGAGGAIVFDAGGTGSILTFSAHRDIAVNATTSFINGTGALNLFASGWTGTVTVNAAVSNVGGNVNIGGKDVAINAAVTASGVGKNVNISVGDFVAGTFTSKAAMTAGAGGMVTVTGGTSGNIFDFSSDPGNTVTIVGGSGTDELKAPAGATYVLTGVDKAVGVGSLFSATGIEKVTGTGTANVLQGTNTGTTYATSGPNAVDAAGISFSGIGSIVAGSGLDTLTGATTYGLTDVDKKVLANGITATGIDGVTAADTVMGSAVNTTYTITGDNALTANQIAFAGVNTLNATASADDMLTGSASYTITGDNAVTASKIAVVGIEKVTAAGAVTGTVASTTYTSSGDNLLNANGIDFTGVNTLAAAAGGTDVFTGAAAYTIDGANAVTANKIAATGIESVTAAGTVVGSDADTKFSIVGAGVVDVASINFTGVANLTGGAGKDTFVFADAGSLTGVVNGGNPATAPGDTIDLTAKTGLVAINTATGSATGMGSFTNIELISGNDAGTTLTGSNISITGVNSGAADGIGFMGVHNLKGTATSSITGLVGGSVAGTITDGGTATTLSGVINSTGNQSYTGAVTLAGATTLAGANVNLGNTVAGAHALAINSAGTTTLNGNVDIASLTTDAAGTTSIGAASIRTSGAQTYGDAVTQTAAATTLDSGSNIALAAGLGGDKALTVKANGNLSLGAATTVASLTTQGTTTLTGAGALTTPVVNVEGTLALGNANQIADGATVNVTGTLDTGANAETVSALNVNGGTVDGTGVLTATGGYNLTSATVNGALGAGTLTQVGGASTLAGTSAASAVNVAGGTLTLGDTANRLTGASTVVIAAGATLDTGAASQALATGAVANSGTLTTGGDISAGLIASSGTATYGGNVTTTGAQTYSGALTTAANSTLEAAGQLSSTNADATTIGDGTTFRMTDNGTVDVSGNYLGSVNVDGSASSVTLTDYSADTPFVVNQMMVDSGASVTLNSAGALTVDAANLSQLAKLTVRVAEGGVRFLNSSTARNGQPGVLATDGITMEVDEGDVNTEADPMWINTATPNLSVTINGAFKAWLAGNVSSDAVTRKFLNDAADGVGASRAEMVRDFLRELKRNVGIGAVEELVLFGGIDMEGITAPLSFSNLAVKLPKCAGEQANSQQCN